MWIAQLERPVYSDGLAYVMHSHLLYANMWLNLQKGTTLGQCTHKGMRQNSRETANSCNRRLLHYWNILCIPYLPAKFETCIALLRLKRGPNSFTASVAFGRVWSRPERIIPGRSDFKYIHGHYASLVVPASETTSAPLYNFRNHWIVSQRTILIVATSVDFPYVERDTSG